MIEWHHYRGVRYELAHKVDPLNELDVVLLSSAELVEWCGHYVAGCDVLRLVDSLEDVHPG
jgi:hypothetical protein